MQVAVQGRGDVEAAFLQDVEDVAAGVCGQLAILFRCQYPLDADICELSRLLTATRCTEDPVTCDRQASNPSFRTAQIGYARLHHGPLSHQVIALAATGQLDMAAARQIRWPSSPAIRPRLSLPSSPIGVVIHTQIAVIGAELARRPDSGPAQVGEAGAIQTSRPPSELRRVG